MDNNVMKRQVVCDMGDLRGKLQQKLDILEALDNDSSCSGSLDLYDQITGLENNLQKISEIMDRCVAIVPRPYKEDTNESV